MGGLAAERVFARIERPGRRAHNLVVEAELVVRASSRPVAASERSVSAP